MSRHQGGPIEITRLVPDHTRVGTITVRASGEAVQHGLLSGPIQLEHRSGWQTGTAAADGGPIEVALLISYQTCGRLGSIRWPGKSVEHGLFAGPVHLEHHTTANASAVDAAIVAPEARSAIEIALLVSNQTRAGPGVIGICPIHSAGKRV